MTGASNGQINDASAPFDTGGGGGAVTSVFGRTGAIVAQTGDYNIAQISGAGTAAGENLTAVITDNGSGGLTIGAGQVTSAMLANTAVTAGSYGSASNVGTFTVNNEGQLTTASNVAIQIAESQVTNLVSDLAGKQSTITLTTIGTSGAATFLSNVLNIPNYAPGTGTVISVSVTPANGVSGTVANPTTTAAITLTLGAITPTSVAASGALSGSNFSGSSSGTNTGDQTNITGNAGTATKWQTARLLAGNSVDGSANVPFANKFIVQGTADTGLSGAQFLGALGTGLVKNTTTTGVLSIAAAGTDYQAPGNYITALTGDGTASGPGSAAFTLATVNSNVGSFGSSTAIPNFTVNAKGLITVAGSSAVIAPAGTLTGTTLASNVVTSSLTSVGTLGSLAVTGATTGGSFVKSGGTSAQFLKADGSVDSTSYQPALGNFTTNQMLYGNGTSTPITSANNTFNGLLQTLTANALGATQDLTKGLFLSNTTAATSGAVLQISPAVHMGSSYWNGTASVSNDIIQYSAPAGPNAPNWLLAGSTGGGPYTSIIGAIPGSLLLYGSPFNINSLDPSTSAATALNISATITKILNDSGTVGLSVISSPLTSLVCYVGVGLSSPTAPLHIRAGTTTYAPLKINPGTLQTTPASGSIETTTSHINWTDGIGPTRQQLDQQVTLTTTGTSGAATYSAYILNIPQYQAAGTYVTGATNATLTLTGTTLGINLANVNSWTGVGNTFNGINVTPGLNGGTRAFYSQAPSSGSFTELVLASENGSLAGFYKEGSTASQASAFNMYTDAGVFNLRAGGGFFFLVGGFPGTAVGNYDTSGNLNWGSSNQFVLNSSGVITSGTWNGGVIPGQYGGTGVANTGKTITLGGNLVTSGAFATTLTSTATTNVSLPITGTLSTLAGSETLTNKTGSSSSNTWFTLTTTGIGAATYTGNTLNIPTPATGVSSITGTANQIIASASTGAVTLSTPQNIDTAAAVTFNTVTLNPTTPSPVVGQIAYESSAYTSTIDSTSGLGYVPSRQYFRDATTGATITTIGNIFGGGSNISLVSGANYRIEVVVYYLKTTGGTATFTFTNSTAPTSMDMEYTLSPGTGIVSAQAATYLNGNQYNVTATAPTVTTGTLTTGANHFAKFTFFLVNGTGTSLKLQMAASAGSVTIGTGSYWICERMPGASTGNFAA